MGFGSMTNFFGFDRQGKYPLRPLRKEGKQRVPQGGVCFEDNGLLVR